MIVVPIGVDCGLADIIKRHNLRYISLPFDWSVSYGGVSEIIRNKFKDFIPVDNNKINKTYNYNFFHNDFPKDNDKINRRCDRFIELLNNGTESLVFIRKGHAFHHHKESENLNLKLENDIKDAEKLNNVLKDDYPELKYKIIVLLVCSKCFDEQIIYESEDVNITIHNIVSPVVDNKRFSELFTKLINHI